ncbi:MAG: biotin/lipoyl-containing protein, partial [Pseudomonadota bacterium]
MSDITVPTLGESVTEATVGQWLKAAGETVSKDDVLVELETDKVAVEVSAEEDGVLSEIVAAEGDTVEIGAVLGRLGGANGATKAAAASEALPEHGGPGEEGTANPGATEGDLTDVTVPSMGESVAEGTIASFLKAPGEQVEKDETIAEIETDKVALEVPSPASGVLSELLVKEGDAVTPGSVIARVSAGGSSGAAAPAAAPSPAPAQTSAPATGSGERPVSPSVRRISSEAGV